MSNFDNGRSAPLAQASAKGTVKWFNATKGYGFITLENGGDAFCHASALAAAGHQDVAQGATVIVDLQESARGLQVVTVHNVDASTADSTPSRGGGGRGRYDDHSSGSDRFGGGDRFGGDDRFSGERFGNRDYGGGRDNGASGSMVEGKVKFFNDQKGFGFVVADNGGQDVYCHASALRRSGLAILSPEQRIRYSTRQGNKGVEVDRIELL